MPMRSFLSLEAKLAASVPGCPAPTIQQYVRDTAIEVCEKTLVWRYKQDPIRLSPGVYEYEYETPVGTEVVAVIHSTVNGTPLTPLVEEDLHRLYPDWPSLDATKRSTPRHMAQFDPDHFLLAPVPDAAQNYDVDMVLALRPTPDAVEMDKTAFDEVEMLILHGTLQHLLVLPNKSWTDRELAMYHARQYVYKTAARRAKANLGVARATLSVKMNPLA